MRTTLDIADDVLLAAKERARRENKTAGEVVSELLRQALTAPQPSAVREPRAVHGFKPFARRGGIVTNELIDQLRNEDAY
ncbi:MAG: antitoxin [Gemmatimonadetes bacterium]|nr:antitoxin [Gemmatimonadota bacterium]